MKKTFKILLVMLVSFLSLTNVEAKTIDHFYSKVDENVEMNEEVNGSMALAGSSIKANSKADGISFLAGNKLEFTGEAEYGVFAGNSIDVKGTISKDTYIAGNIITIDASLQRDVIIAGADVKISGNIGRNVSVYASSVTLENAQISGSVKIYATQVSVDKQTVINGDLSYPKDAEGDINKDSINGKIIKTDEIQTDDDNFITTIVGKFWSFMSLILIFAVLSLLMPKVFTNIQEKYEKLDFNKGIELFTEGLIFLILIPVISCVLILISIGIPLALILLALYFIIIYLSKIFMAYLIGYKLWQKFFDNDINMLVIGILGLAVLFILSLIPGVSMLVNIITLIMGIGIIYDNLKIGLHQ